MTAPSASLRIPLHTIFDVWCIAPANVPALVSKDSERIVADLDL